MIAGAKVRHFLEIAIIIPSFFQIPQQFPVFAPAILSHPLSAHLPCKR